MKTIYTYLTAAFILLAAHTSSAQTKTVKYLSKSGYKEVPASEAYFFEVGEKNKNGGGTRARFLRADSSKVSLNTYSDLDGGQNGYGTRHGAYYKWHSNGKVAEQGTYINGERSGLVQKWYENGQLSFEENYVSGKLQDTLKGYYDDGKLRRIEIYSKGEMLKGTVYAKDGAELPYIPVMVMPEFPGGERAMQTFLAQTIRYPSAAQRRRASGLVVIAFTVKEDGTRNEMEVIKSVDKDLDAEAIRVINAMPAWKPGLQEGKPAAINFVIPVRFTMYR